MCSVCGCGDSHVEDHSHHHHEAEHHDHSHHHPHSGESEIQSMVVHHHYSHQGDVHHHIHYHVHSGDAAAESLLAHQTEHDHHEKHHHHHDEHHQPEVTSQGDLHYGKGKAKTHVTGVSQRSLINLEQDILSQNNLVAGDNREHFREHHQLALNLMSSPGSGKTTLLVETLKLLQSTYTCAVIEGDQQTSQDANRIRETSTAAIQVNTGKGCHLDAQMIHRAYHQLDMQEPGILFIENVGNLVCPASFDLGEQHKVTILSVTEGDDKPLKYPNMFAASQLMLINKIDLLDYVNFDIEACIANARKINPEIQVIKLSATSGEGMSAWIDWLTQQQKLLAD
ncbi:hydrogenase nickel incorporation protein HypB [Vibrio mangrovi]|uniref:Hydrogenase maturation factor HypB n=1 Tax=Vibrio mangrovi TaxID=474394 RepID=A0A1Y6IXM5_9VIBR|nr:hydrogenase nickel incorporation protein HypB [Vibrio mangrovi]MDW6002018.1 hydrogenase nickel incorporation protein HypB [Vibrio mangrovi]SMS02435.1 Hydrogenase isoenzymes nickel incorporation protein HypB [Vibrio mangrovi]